MRRISKLVCGMLGAAALAGAGAARADVTWFVQGLFDDGTTFDGSFVIDNNGFIEKVSSITTARDTYAGSNSSLDNNTPPTAIDFQRTPGFDQDLRLFFAHDLSVATSSPNPILGGPSGPSYECRDSGFCFKGDPASGGTFHFVVSGQAQTTPFGSSAPEPASWALMIAGFALAGGALRRRTGWIPYS